MATMPPQPTAYTATVDRWNSHSSGPPVARASTGSPATTTKVLPSSPAAPTSSAAVAGSPGRRT